MTMTLSPTPRSDLRPPILWGIAGLAVLMGVGLVWSMLAMVSGAVIASGQAVVRGEAKLVQTLDGGTVVQIAVKNGDLVKAGQVLVRLDPTAARVNLDAARSQLADALARRARLQAEQTGLGVGLAAPDFDYPPLPFARPDTARQEAAEAALFTVRADEIAGKRRQLADQLTQFSNQIAGTAAQIAAKQDQLRFLETDLANVQTLVTQGLAPQSQLLDKKRGQSDLLGQIAALQTEEARLNNSKHDSELTTLQGERAFREEVLTQLAEVSAKIDTLTLDIVTRAAQLQRVEIRAPEAGIVHQLAVTTIGGVAAAGATLLQVVPLSDGVDFQLRIDPKSVDQVYPGQPARVVMAAFNTRTTPQLMGTVTAVSPGTITDPVTGQSYYRAELTVPPAEIARLGDVVLMPGMPVEAFLTTGERSVMAYLLDPLSARLGRAFREE